MCGICAIITPYGADLVDPELGRTHEPNAVTSSSQRPGPHPTVSTSPNAEASTQDLGNGNGLLHPATSTTPPSASFSSTHLNLYAASFKYKDARPRTPGSEPPYTEIQRPRSISRSRSRLDEHRGVRLTADGAGDSEANGNGEGNVRGNGKVDGNGTGIAGARDPGEKSVWVDTARAKQAAQEGQDPAVASTTVPSSSSPSSTSPAGTPSAMPTQSESTTSPTTAATEPSSPYRIRLENELLQSLETIAHRGPDGKGVWIGEDCRVALGHVRLSIRDLSVAGRQPMHSDDDNVHIVVNGEIYMYEELKATLESRGFTFHSHSDSELVLYLYMEYGQDFLQHLRGEFSLIVYDSAKRVVIAARDRYGIKPLFWTVTPEGRILIGAEMKSFLGLGLVPEWDVKCLRDCGWLYDTRTILRGVNRLRPGHMLVIGLDGTIESKPYWEPSYPDKNVPDNRTFEEMVEGVRSRLIDSVACRLRADVPIGVYLSGGIDSSVVAGIVTHLLKNGLTAGSQDSRKLKCFTIEFDAGAHNEVAIAKRTADFLGVDFKPMHASEQMLVDNFEQAVWAIEQPANDLNFVGKYMLSRFVSGQGYPVVLTGEGADEHFAGYSLFLADYLAEADRTAPQMAIDDQVRERHLTRVRDMAQDEPGRNAFVRNPVEFPGKSNVLRSINHLEYPQIQSNGVSDMKVFAGWTEGYGQGNPILTLVDQLDGVIRSKIRDSWHPLHSALYMSLRPMDGIVLSSLGDRSEMGHSLEGRPPFLDPVVTDYVNHLPPSAKITIDAKGMVKEKRVLREASRPFISDELYERTKHPYSAPANYPTGGAVHALILKHVTEEKLEALGFVDIDYAKRLLKEAFQEGGMGAFRQVLMLAQYTILQTAFGIKTAMPLQTL